LALVPASSQASLLVSWHFDPAEHHMSPGDEILLTAILLNEPASTESLVAADVLDGRGANWLPDENLYQEGLDVQFVFDDVDGVVLAPGEAFGFLWGTVTNWKEVDPGEYTIDFATIHAHNAPTEIRASNRFTIVFVPEPASGSLMGLGLAIISLAARARHPGATTRILQGVRRTRRPRGCRSRRR
jgi:hypothetical protein